MTNEENTLQMENMVSVQTLSDRIDRLDLQLAQMQQRSRMCWRLVFLAAAIVTGGKLLTLMWNLLAQLRLYFQILHIQQQGAGVASYNFWGLNGGAVLSALVLTVLLALCVYGIWKMRAK